MKVRLLVPEEKEVELEEVLRCLAAGPNRMAPFSEEAIAFGAAFSRRLFKDPQARRFAQLQALAFWMREAELKRLQTDFRRLESENVLLAPCGLVFHIPPANVDTLFIYSWMLSLLTGNRSIVRLSSRRSEVRDLLCRIVNEVLAGADPQLVGSVAMIGYGHDLKATEAVSALCQVRVIWGGDSTVGAIRRVPLPPRAREIAFPDRFSYSVILAQAFLDLDAPSREGLVERFYNDMYWFDQMGCSSPRLLVWCGPESVCGPAESLFLEGLQKHVVKKGYKLETGAVLEKMLFACQAILDQPVSEYRRHSNELAVLKIDASQLRRTHCGAGLLFIDRRERLADLAETVRWQDQTLTHFGFSIAELRDFARRLNGRGLDRMVPIGQALRFHRFWDGFDLLQELTQKVHIEAPQAEGPML